jgi:hypothetical protein
MSKPLRVTAIIAAVIIAALMSFAGFGPAMSDNCDHLVGMWPMVHCADGNSDVGQGKTVFAPQPHPFLRYRSKPPRTRRR